MTRLPSRRTLVGMSAENRWSTLAAFARDLQAEIDGVENDHIRLTNGLTKSKALGNARRRLARVYEAATVLGIDIADQKEAA